MWLGGVSLWAKYKRALPAALSLIYHNPFISPQTLAMTRRTIGIAIACLTLLTFLLIRKLLGLEIALLSGIFIACDPIYLAQSRRLHTDALAAGFTLLAALTLLLYLENPRKRNYLILSGVSFGLASLSKSTSFILLPWLPFAFGVYLGILPILSAIYGVLGWSSTACLTFIALWPALWQLSVKVRGLSIPISIPVVILLFGIALLSYRRLKEKGKHISAELISASVLLGFSLLFVVRRIGFVIQRIHVALTTPHEVAHLFMGRVVHDPGWLFYPVMLSVKSAPLTLPLALVGLLFLWRFRERQEYAQRFRIASLLFILLVLFTLCLTITAKKFSRYLLVGFLVLDVLAAIGLHTAVKWMFNRIGHKTSSIGQWIQVSLLSLATIIQVIPVLHLHPYYGTYYNPCWKVTDIRKVCTIGDGSGLDIAAEYLNRKPEAKRLLVCVSPLAAELFSYYFKGRAYRSDYRYEFRKPDYEVVYIRDLQIGRVRMEKIDGRLEKIIRLNGVEYVWIYRL